MNKAFVDIVTESHQPSNQMGPSITLWAALRMSVSL